MLAPIIPYSKHLKSYQRKMRRDPTPAEECITDLLCKCKVKFVRQQCFYDPVTKVCYIADFWLSEYKVVIECDGCQHYTPDGLREDKTRDKHFKTANIKTIRLKNSIALGLSKRKLLNLLRKIT